MSSPERTATRTCSVSLRRSAAPTLSAPAAPPGPEIEPKAGPAGRSLPAGATTSVSRFSAPSTARDSGASAKEMYGSASPTTAMRAASCVSPSPFGSTAASRPAINWSLRP